MVRAIQPLSVVRDAGLWVLHPWTWLLGCSISAVSLFWSRRRQSVS